MKKILLFLCITLFLSKGFAQVAISTSGLLPDGSAMLDVVSTVKGVLFPRLTMAQRDAIIFPANGLMIYQTDNTQGIYVNVGTGFSPSWGLAGSSGSGWTLTGNSGTVDGTNFIGTSDNVPFNIRVNNQKSGRIDQTLGNAYFGYQSGNANITGFSNAAFGGSTLLTNTSGNNNTAIGYTALYYNTTGFKNTGSGAGALKSNTTGWDNTANGFVSLFNNIGGSGNTANGSNSMYLNTSGSSNTATGYTSLYSNTSGSQNTANGYQSLYSNLDGNNNTASGFAALFSNTSGYNNTAYGINSLMQNTTGGNNTATGSGSLTNNTYGVDNVASGYEALYANISGGGNVANGKSALHNNTTGDFNTANGNLSLSSNTGGTENTATGVAALQFNTTGYGNTADGANALSTNTTGNYNTAIGKDADVSSNDLWYSTSLGNGAVVNATNKIRLGSSSVTVIEGQVAYTYPSDGRFKNNVKEDVKGLEFISKLRPVTYQFDTKMFDMFLMKNMPDNTRQKRTKNTDYTESAGIIHTGFIAQEVEKAAQECGFNFDGVVAPKDKNGNYGVAYSQFTVPLVKAVQELNEKNMLQQKRIEELEARLEKLEKEDKPLRH